MEKNRIILNETSKIINTSQNLIWESRIAIEDWIVSIEHCRTLVDMTLSRIIESRELLEKNI